MENLKKVPLEEKRNMLQALNTDPKLIGMLRRKLKRLMREDYKMHKSLKKKPKGEFVKLLITHKGWNAAEIRNVIREPEVCKLQSGTVEAERIWGCERNIPTIGSWLLNNTSMEYDELTVEKRF